MFPKLLAEYKKNPFFLAVIFVLVLMRFSWIDSFPVGMTNDEIEYSLSGKSYSVTGTDISGEGLPMSILRSKTEGSISIVPPLILSGVYTVFPMNHASSRFPYVLISIFSGILLSLFVYALFKNRGLSYLVLVFYLINPWSFYLSRYVADAPFALFFYLAGVVSLFYVKKNRLLYSLLLFILGFFSYHGAKLIFLPLYSGVALYVYVWAHDRIRIQLFLKNALSILLFPIIFLVGYLLADKLTPGSTLSVRSHELFIFNQSMITGIVDEQRKNIISNPFTEISLNKVTVSIKIFIEKYSTAFSPDVLFVHGDSRAAYRFENFGLFYPFDFILVLLGLIFLARTNIKVLSFLLFLVFISPLATALNAVETSVIHRSFMLLPLLLIFSAAGFYWIDSILRKRGQVIFRFFAFLLLAVSFGGFLQFYFFSYPVTHQEVYHLSERVLSAYANRSNTSEVVYVVDKPRSAYLRYLFYNPESIQAKLIKEGKDNFANGKFKLQNVSFINSCPNYDQKVTYAVHRNLGDCFSKSSSNIVILDQKDAGQVIKISGGDYCSDIAQSTWRRGNFLKDYRILDLDDKSFCERWIFKSS